MIFLWNHRWDCRISRTKRCRENQLQWKMITTYLILPQERSIKWPEYWNWILEVRRKNRLSSRTKSLYPTWTFSIIWNMQLNLNPFQRWYCKSHKKMVGVCGLEMCSTKISENSLKDSGKELGWRRQWHMSRMFLFWTNLHRDSIRIR